MLWYAIICLIRVLVLYIYVVLFSLLHSHLLPIISHKSCPQHLFPEVDTATLGSVVSNVAHGSGFDTFLLIFSLAVLIVVRYRI